mmetsp:Transcript_57207/g.107302  ORF Transcript_57207/g.107302 Transcript_57207/m.107302 type:complete len:284 (-) Transcript_57207:319-1170(-)
MAENHWLASVTPEPLACLRVHVAPFVLCVRNMESVIKLRPLDLPINFGADVHVQLLDCFRNGAQLCAQAITANMPYYLPSVSRQSRLPQLRVRPQRLSEFSFANAMQNRRFEQQSIAAANEELIKVLAAQSRGQEPQQGFNGSSTCHQHQNQWRSAVFFHPLWNATDAPRIGFCLLNRISNFFSKIPYRKTQALDVGIIQCLASADWCLNHPGYGTRTQIGIIQNGAHTVGGLPATSQAAGQHQVRFPVWAQTQCPGCSCHLCPTRRLQGAAVIGHWRNRQSR